MVYFQLYIKKNVWKVKRFIFVIVNFRYYFVIFIFLNRIGFLIIWKVLLLQKKIIHTKFTHFLPLYYLCTSDHFWDFSFWDFLSLSSHFIFFLDFLFYLPHQSLSSCCIFFISKRCINLVCFRKICRQFLSYINQQVIPVDISTCITTE